MILKAMSGVKNYLPLVVFSLCATSSFLSMVAVMAALLEALPLPHLLMGCSLHDVLLDIM